jgi:hypothetical protein
MQAVASEFVRGRCHPEVTGGCPLGQQVSHHFAEPLLRSGHPLATMQKRSEFGVVVSVGLSRDASVGGQDGLESLARAACLASRCTSREA